MGWEPGRALLLKKGGKWKQAPQVLIVPERESFLSFKDSQKIARYLNQHGLDEDTRPHVDGTMTKYKWKRKVKTKRKGVK